MKKYSKPTLVLFCGLPGSGKTTLAKKLEKSGNGIRICTDDWQSDLEVEAIALDDMFHERLQKRLYRLALELLQNRQSVILEDGLWMKPERDMKLSDAQKFGAKTELHFFDLTFDEIWDRLQTRNSGLPHGAVPMTKQELEKCWQLFEKPNPDELAKFDKVFVYDNKSEHPDH